MKNYPPTSNPKNKRDLVVIGGGAGGLNLASAASQLGLKVTLIERQSELGGDCLHYGCVPSKAFIHAAKVAWTLKHAQHYGINVGDYQVSLQNVNQYVRGVISAIQQHDDPKRFESYGCEILFGKAKFINEQAVSVGDQIREGKRIVIASGSSPNILPIPGMDKIRYLTNETIFYLTSVPKKLIVLGGGAIGIEMAQAFFRLGSQVIVLDNTSRILDAIDEEAALYLQALLRKEGLEIYGNIRVESVLQAGSVIKLKAKDITGKEIVFEGDALLLATGRKPNVDLDLEKAGIKYSASGIQVDKRLRTSNKNIFAMGDVAQSPFKLTHLAEYHAGIVIANAVFRLPQKVDYRYIPSVIFSDPECATVGLTSQKANEKGISYNVLNFPFLSVDKAVTDGETAGFAKLLVHKKRIIGATLLGAHAGELLPEIALAMKHKLSIGTISDTIHAYPTLSQVNRRAVNTYYAKKLFSPLARKIARWLSYLP